jgi:glutathione S-transferase
MFFEQSRVEPTIAVARFLAAAGRDRDAPDAFAQRVAGGRSALRTLERGLADGRPFLTGDAYTVADMALYGYVHCAGEVGADPREHEHLAAWLDRVEGTEGFVNDLAPFPPHVAERPA